MTATPGRSRSPLSLALLVVALAVGAVAVWTSRDEVLSGLASIGWPRAAGSLAAAVTGVLATAACWWTWLGAVEDDPPAPPTMGLFLATQAGKYLPGSVWPFLAQAALSRRFGMTPGGVLTATALFLVSHIATGAALGVATFDRDVVDPRLLAVGAVLCLAVLTPRVQRGLLGLAARWRPQLAADVAVSWTRTGAAVGWMLVAWVAYGVSTLLLATPLGASPADAPAVTGAFALAWTAGFLALPTPAGAGARELALVALLGPVVGAGGALTVAVVSRAVMTLADLGLAAGSARVLLGDRPTPG